MVWELRIPNPKAAPTTIMPPAGAHQLFKRRTLSRAGRQRYRPIAIRIPSTGANSKVMAIQSNSATGTKNERTGTENRTARNQPSISVVCSPMTVTHNTDSSAAATGHSRFIAASGATYPSQIAPTNGKTTAPRASCSTLSHFLASA